MTISSMPADWDALSLDSVYHGTTILDRVYRGTDILFSRTGTVAKMFGSDSDMVLLGSVTAHTSTTETRMTTSSSQASGAYWSQKVDLTQWSLLTAEWTMTMSAGGADGTAFVLLNAANYPSAPAINGGGSDMALISGQMAAIEQRTYSYDRAYRMDLGDARHAHDLGYFDDWSGTHVWKVVINLSSSAASLSKDGLEVVTTTFDNLPSEAWVGWVAATGGVSETQTNSNGSLLLT